MRIYQDQILAVTATGVVCLFIGFASIAEMSERPGAFGWAVMLGVALIAALIIGIILYRGHDSPRAAAPLRDQRGLGHQGRVSPSGRCVPQDSDEPYHPVKSGGD